MPTHEVSPLEPFDVVREGETVEQIIDRVTNFIAPQLVDLDPIKKAEVLDAIEAEFSRPELQAMDPKKQEQAAYVIYRKVITGEVPKPKEEEMRPAA